jgi:hypothetical protein
MWNFLWRKEMVFYYENRPVAECVGSRRVWLSVHFGIASFSGRSSFAGSLFDVAIWKMSSKRCSLLALALMNISGTLDSESKSEHALFSRKHSNPSICVTLNGQCMSDVPKFQHLLRGAHVNYALCCKRMNFL